MLTMLNLLGQSVEMPYESCGAMPHRLLLMPSSMPYTLLSRHLLLLHGFLGDTQLCTITGIGLHPE